MYHARVGHDMCGGSSCRCISDCNPRAPCGARRTLSRVVALLAAISIHAPAWGATQALLRPPISLIISIHAPAWGATADDLPRADVLAFQSTRPRGARLTMRVTRSGSLAFQSTRPRGARLRFGGRARTAAPFQSTRPRGARQGTDQDCRFIFRFQSTRPAWGRDDGVPHLYIKPIVISIHAPRMGARRVAVLVHSSAS